MAAQDRFSLHRYSLGSINNDILIEMTFTEELKAVVGPAILIPSTAILESNFQTIVQGTCALLSDFDVEDELIAETEMNANICIKPLFTEVLNQRSIGAKDIKRKLTFSDALRMRTHACKDMPRAFLSEGELHANAYIGKRLYQSFVFTAEFWALTEATMQETETISVSVSIPPGGELRIDSESFQMTLNGANVLYAHSGDWIRISRDLLRLDITGSGGTLQGSLIYTERYL